MKKESGENSGVVSQTDVKDFLKILEIYLQSPTTTETVFALCDSACNHSMISEKLAVSLLLQRTATKATVHGIKSQQVVETQLVQLKLTLVHSGDTDNSTFDIKPFVRQNFVLAMTLLTLTDEHNSTFIWKPFLSKDRVIQTPK